MKTVDSKNILITGGAQGIGRLLAERAVEENAQVILWDINVETLATTAQALKLRGGQVWTCQVDLSSVESIDRAARETLEQFGHIDILVNNAGIVVGKDFSEHSALDIEKTMAVNTLAPMHVARAFLPAMTSRPETRIVNIASAAGLVPNPKMSVYAASKWAVIGWSESLRLECEREGGELKVTTVTPSYIDTGMFDGVKAPLLTPLIKPEKMADAIWQGMKKGKVYVRAPKIVGLVPFFRGIMPARLFDLVCGKGLRIYNSMNEFKGHAPH